MCRTGNVFGTDHETSSKIEIYLEGSSLATLSSGAKIINAELYKRLGRMVLNMGGDSREIRFDAEQLADVMCLVKSIQRSGVNVTKKIKQ